LHKIAGPYDDCAMVPFADCINHENIDVSYDHIFPEGKNPNPAKVQSKLEKQINYEENSSGCESNNEESEV